MAAHGNKFIRVRLHFDYPPPAVVDCRMCWLLVDLNTCRVVADVESLIREKFEFSRRSILSLFIEDCYLPHTESVHVVRDNDSVRVKVDCLAQVNGHSSAPDAASRSCRKRQRPTEEDGLEQNGVSVEWKKKKRKKRSEENLVREAQQALGDESSEKSQVKKKKKKKKVSDNGASLTPKPAASTQKTPASVDQPVKSSKKPPAAPKTQIVSSSDSSSSSSEEDEAPQKPAAKTPSSTPAAASKTPPATKPTQKTPHPPSSSSSDSDSSEEDSTRKTLPKNKTPPKGPTNANAKPLHSTGSALKSAGSSAAPPHDESVAPCNSDSEDEIKLVIRRPMQQSGHGAGSPSSWRGHGRGQPRCGGRGRGGGRGANRGSEFSHNGAKEPSYNTDSLTNVSVVLQNKECSMAPRQDYSSLPLLAAPPQVGQKIAFKLLELTENYTPEVSEYKEGKIVSFDLTTKQIELELLNTSQAHVEPGKFDLVYQNPDGSESVEYAVSRSSRVTERWDSLLEPRLII